MRDILFGVFVALTVGFGVLGYVVTPYMFWPAAGFAALTVVAHILPVGGVIVRFK